MTHKEMILACLAEGGATVENLVSETNIPEKSVRAWLSIMVRANTVRALDITSQDDKYRRKLYILPT